MFQDISCDALSIRSLSNHHQESVITSKASNLIAFRDIDFEILAGDCWMNQASVCYLESAMSQMAATTSKLALDLLSQIHADPG